MKSHLPAFIIFTIIAFAFRDWFSLLPLSTGDWVYKFPEAIAEFNLYPYAWITGNNYGFGGNGVFILALNTYFSAGTAILSNYLNIPWVLVEKIMWFWPFTVIAAYGSFIFFRKFLVADSTLSAVSSLIFTANTYVFMVAGGGQMGVAAAYAMIPLVFYGFLKILEEVSDDKKTLSFSILGGILFSIQLLLDLRLAYATMIFVGIYYLLTLLTGEAKITKKSFVPFIIIPALITFFLNFFWLVPFVILGRNPLAELGVQYSTSGIIEFLSFAKLENTISLLQPNWPENLFGKAYFMRPEFIVLPILAFASLLFVKKDKYRKNILAFSLIALLAAFLAKGTNEPFGTFYTWAFNNIPGFAMFRDPTKWYGIVIFSFSLLIPYSLFAISAAKPQQKHLKNLLVFTFVVLWVITIRQSFTGELGGTFRPKIEPQQYVALSKFLSSQKDFFRTLWVPKFHQYSYSSNTHPVIPAEDYFAAHDPAAIGAKIENNLALLSETGVKYVIVPADTEGRIFIDDRKYKGSIYQNTVRIVSGIKGLSRTAEFGKIIVFSLPASRDHFWTDDKSVNIKYKYINPTRYVVEVKNAKANSTLVFSESYDEGWYIGNSEFSVQSQKYKKKLNSFTLPVAGSYTFEAYYKPQELVDKALVVSVISIVLIFFVLIWQKIKK